MKIERNHIYILTIHVHPSDWEDSGIYGAEIVISSKSASEGIDRVVARFKEFGRDCEVTNLRETDAQLTYEDIEYLATDGNKNDT